MPDKLIKLTKMRLVRGKFQTLESVAGQSGKRVMKVPGDIVGLTDNQLKAFKDQFEDPGLQESRTAKAKKAKLEEQVALKEAAAAKAALEAETFGELAEDEKIDPPADEEAPRPNPKGKK